MLVRDLIVSECSHLLVKSGLAIPLPTPKQNNSFLDLNIDSTRRYMGLRLHHGGMIIIFYNWKLCTSLKPERYFFWQNYHWWRGDWI